MSGFFRDRAIASAVIVFPVPGGPANRRESPFALRRTFRTPPPPPRENRALVPQLDEGVLDGLHRLRGHHDVVEGEAGLHDRVELRAVRTLVDVLLEGLHLLLGLVHLAP